MSRSTILMFAASAVIVFLVLGVLGWVTFVRNDAASASAAPHLQEAEPAAASSSLTEVDVIPVDILNTDFPMATDAFNLADIGDGSLTYSTTLSTEEVLKFYRDEYTTKGYMERAELGTVSGSYFHMVFGGDPSGQAVVVQCEDVGDGSRTVTIRLEDN